jgi:5'-deoxynucleotidase YfbR-like HD superfamily hydrolase
LTTILARRIKSEIRCDLHDSIIVLGWLYDSLENCELKSFIETLLDVDCSVDNDYPARQIGRFFAAKNAPRNGWVTRGIQYPETVGAHTASLIWLCNLISEDDQKDIDVNRIRRMLEIHDLSEGITGDIVKPEKDPKYEQIERDLLRKLSWLGLFMDPVINLFSIYKLYDEFASKNTKEAQLANEIDSIDIVIHANSLLIAMKELINRKAMNELIENERSKVKSAIGKHIMKTALNMQLYSKESFIIDCELKAYIFGETMKNESSVLKIKLDELGLELDDAISILNEMHQLKKEYQEMVIQYIKSLAEKETKSD